MTSIRQQRSSYSLAVWVVVPILFVMAIALAACGDDNDPLANDDNADDSATNTDNPADDTGNDNPDTSDDTTDTGASNGGGTGTLADIPRETGADASLTGAGATFPNVLYTAWVEEYNQLNPGVRVNYQSIGSGGGIRAVIDRTVDFGGTDGPMTDDQKADAGDKVWHIPAAMGAVVPAYNISGAPDDLRFSQETIAGIFLGDIASWDDQAIREDNPDAELPNQDIAVCHRSDGSGTTFIWVDFLASVSDEWAENVGVATSVEWPRGNFVGGNGNEGVAQCINQIDGAVGYVELAYATQNNLPVAQLENQAGKFVEPTLAAVTSAAAGLIEAGEFPTDMEARVVNAPGDDSWPAAGFTWLLVYEEMSATEGMTLGRAQELIRYMLWALDQDGGQTFAEPLDYAPLDPNVVELAYEGIKQLTFEGQPVWETMLP